MGVGVVCVCGLGVGGGRGGCTGSVYACSDMCVTMLLCVYLLSPPPPHTHAHLTVISPSSSCVQ